MGTSAAARRAVMCSTDNVHNSTTHSTEQCNITYSCGCATTTSVVDGIRSRCNAGARQACEIMCVPDKANGQRQHVVHVVDPRRPRNNMSMPAITPPLVQLSTLRFLRVCLQTQQHNARLHIGIARELKRVATRCKICLLHGRRALA